MRRLAALLLLAATPAFAGVEGVYRLEGVREAASGLELTADGHFRYGLTYGALTLGAPTLEQRYGVHLGDTLPGLYDFALIGVVTGASAVLGFIPAWAAFHNSLADGMTIRT